MDTRGCFFTDTRWVMRRVMGWIFLGYFCKQPVAIPIHEGGCVEDPTHQLQ